MTVLRAEVSPRACELRPDGARGRVPDPASVVSATLRWRWIRVVVTTCWVLRMALLSLGAIAEMKEGRDQAVHAASAAWQMRAYA